MGNMVTKEWLEVRRRNLTLQVNGYNEIGFTVSADIAQGQIDLIDEMLQDMKNN